MYKNNFKIFLFHGVIKKKQFKIRNYTSKHITETKFINFLKRIKKNGKVLSLDETIYRIKNKLNLPNNTYVITFDDGFENNYSVAAPILAEMNMPATFYFSTDFIENNSISWIDKIEYAFEKKKEGEILLPYAMKKVKFNSINSKIKILNNIRKIVKSNFKINIDRFLSQIFKELNIVMPKTLNSPIDKKINWKQIKHLNSEELFTVGGHSHEHKSLASMQIKEMRQQIRKSFYYFKIRAGITLKHYSYPEGQKNDFNSQIINELKKRNIISCPTAINGHNSFSTDLFKLKRIMVV